jgi:hypothetical protein
MIWCGNSIMAAHAACGFRRNLGTGKSLLFVRCHGCTRTTSMAAGHSKIPRIRQHFAANTSLPVHQFSMSPMTTTGIGNSCVANFTKVASQNWSVWGVWSREMQPLWPWQICLPGGAPTAKLMTVIGTENRTLNPKMMNQLTPNPTLNTDRPTAALLGSLRPSASGGRLAPR